MAEFTSFENGQTSDAPETKDYIGRVSVKGMFNNMYSEQYNGGTNYKKNGDEYGFEAKVALSASSGPYTITYGSTTPNTGLIFANLYDDFEDASINGTLWTTSTSSSGGGSATVTESGGSLTLSTNAPSSPSSGTAIARAINADYETNDGSFICEVTHIQQGGGVIGQAYIRVSDGTNFVNVVSIPNTGSTSNIYVYELYFDVSAQTVKFRSKTTKKGDWSAWSGGTDISTVTGNWNVEFWCYSNYVSLPVGSILDVWNTWYVQNGTVNQIYTNTSFATARNTAVGGFMDVNVISEGSYTGVFYLSGNSGTNYETMVRNTYKNFTVTGTGIGAKVDITTPADRPVYVDEIGVGWLI